MKEKFLLTSLVTLLLFLSGCQVEDSQESVPSTVDQGWHNQGKDCLACHNLDLQNEKHLLFGGTLYKDQNITNQDDINSVCGGDLVVNFYDSSFTLKYSSKDYMDPHSKGTQGKGNIFILQRLLNSNYGNFYVQVADTNGNVLAVSTTLHNFSAQMYDVNNPSDMTNRISCNACHQIGGTASPLYVNNTINKNLCQ